MSYREDFLSRRELIVKQESLFRVRQHYNYRGKTLHLFFEAEDDYEFYRKSIEYIFKGFKIFPYYKKGKKNVIISFEVFDWDRYNKSRILFFVDKDYEDILGTSSKLDFNVFVTKYYSIENYISSVDVFKYCLENIFKIKSNQIVNEIIEKYNIAYQIFEKNLKILTAVILIFRENNAHLELDKLKMDELFLISGLTLHQKKFKNPILFNQIKQSAASSLAKSLIVPHKKMQLIEKCCDDNSLITKEKIKANLQN